MQENRDSRDNDEIGFVDIFMMIINESKQLFSLLKRHVLVISLAASLGGLFGFFYAYSSDTIYNAKLSFMVTSSNNSGLISSLSNLSGIFSTSSNSTLGLSLDRIEELIGSDRIISGAMFKKVTINEKKDLIINHFIQLEELHKEWSKTDDDILAKVVFNDNVESLSNLTFVEKNAFKKIKSFISHKSPDGIISVSSNTKTGIINLTVHYKNEFFVIELANSLYEELLKFYIERSRYSSKSNVKVLERKVDSIKEALNDVQNLLARTSDKTLGLYLQENKVETRKLGIEEQMLIVMYAEAQKNLEGFKLINDTDSSPLTLMDYPFSPIIPIGKSKLIFLILGFVIFGLITLLFLRLKILVEKNIRI